jgi:predicted DNA-binding transcriptional regulator AlpA
MPAGRGKKKLPTRRVMERYDVCDRTIDRWVADPHLNFPRPVRIKRRRYWDEDELDAFDASQG